MAASGAAVLLWDDRRRECAKHEGSDATTVSTGSDSAPTTPWEPPRWLAHATCGAEWERHLGGPDRGGDVRHGATPARMMTDETTELRSMMEKIAWADAIEKTVEEMRKEEKKAGGACW